MKREFGFKKQNYNIKGDSNMKPVKINNSWYIEISSDDRGYVLMATPDMEKPMSFESMQSASDYILDMK